MTVLIISQGSVDYQILYSSGTLVTLQYSRCRQPPERVYAVSFGQVYDLRYPRNALLTTC